MTSTQTTVAHLRRALDGMHATVGLAAFRGDPVAFAAACGLDCEDWQAALLQSSAKRIAILAARQSGKTVVAAIMALYQAVYTPGSLVLIASPTLHQSQESFEKVRTLLNGLSVTSEVQVPSDSESALSLRLSNRSRIVALCGKERSTRGYSNVALLVVDEAARVDDAFYYSMRPTLAVSGGRLVALSTPFGKRGWLWETIFRDDVVATDDTWLRVTRTAEQCPHYVPGFLEEERRTLGWWWYSQEYECAWNQAQDRVFRDEDIARMFEEDYEVWPLGLDAASTQRTAVSTQQIEADDDGTWDWGNAGAAPAVAPTRVPPQPRPLAAIEAERRADVVWRTGQGYDPGRW